MKVDSKVKMRKTSDQHKRRLVERYLSGEATEKELVALFGLLATDELNQVISESMDSDIHAMQVDQKEFKKRREPWPKLIVVSFILAMVSVIGYYWWNPDKNTQHVDAIASVDIQPGGNRATLTLANGRTFTLSENQDGVIVNADAGEVNYIDGTQLSGIDVSSEGTSFNIITTPRGGQYRITLADGTKVWLNAASSLTYPSTFSKNERVVTLTGEGYFEVATVNERPQGQKRIPFKVITKNQEVEVKGTHFNINAYEDEEMIRTTLVEGRVRVHHIQLSSSKDLSPGQQSILKPSHWEINKANIAESISWIRGIFYFKDTPIDKLMRQVARWYDIKVVYASELPDEFFTGEMSRNVSLSVFLQFLKGSGIDFTIEGRTLTIKNKGNT